MARKKVITYNDLDKLIDDYKNDRPQRAGLLILKSAGILPSQQYIPTKNTVRPSCMPAGTKVPKTVK